ncbi:hypothetical protein HMPREF9141_1730 [Prevotella multiformis DSM 16608]|uniref:Uncharacterized protein n=1 Tax=Prevotella multiformis DSM 16608 TaxID=888743 RepID=F0F813_9BACT|nr:hypothetical protein HMPREF9141_1730 [Prevotella multiformis DSM 16608]
MRSSPQVFVLYILYMLFIFYAKVQTFSEKRMSPYENISP